MAFGEAVGAAGAAEVAVGPTLESEDDCIVELATPMERGLK